MADLHHLLSVFSLFSSSPSTLFPEPAVGKTRFSYTEFNVEKNPQLLEQTFFPKLLWPFQMKTAHLSFPSAQHNPRCSTFVSAPSPTYWAVQLYLCSRWISGGVWPVYNSNTDTYSVCRNTTSQEVSQHEKLPNDRLQEIQFNPSKEKGHSIQMCAIRLENHDSNIIISVCQPGCTGKGQRKFRDLLQMAEHNVLSAVQEPHAV